MGQHPPQVQLEAAGRRSRGEINITTSSEYLLSAELGGFFLRGGFGVWSMLLSCFAFSSPRFSCLLRLI